MKITRENYESFFLDYIEGNLEESQIDQFLDFLELNPDLKEELQLFESVKLPEQNIVFQEKESLYKKAETRYSDNDMVAYLEGDTEPGDRALFESYLELHPELQKQRRLFESTRLKPDLNVVFPEKGKLYRKPARVVAFNWVARVAAAIVLLWGINSVYHNTSQPVVDRTNQEIAGLHSTVPEPPVKQNDSEKKTVEPNTDVKPQKPASGTKAVKSKSIREKTRGRLEEKRSVEPKPAAEKDLTALAYLSPINARLNSETPEIALAVRPVLQNEEQSDRTNQVMGIDEFLAEKAKNIGNEGLLSAKRLARTGLGLVSELSGEMISYSEQNGKITSVDIGNRLLAFSIPVKKNK